MSGILIKNAFAVTMCGRETIDNAYILTDGNQISYIGQECPCISQDTKIIDACGAIVMPATVNMHTHLAMTYFRSYATDLPLTKWLERIFEIEDKLDEEAMYYGALLACAEAMEHGSACVNDMYLNTYGTARACLDSGIRAYIARSVVDVDGKEGLERRIKENNDIRKRFHNADGGRVQVINSVHAEYTCSPLGMKRVYDDAKEHGCPVHIHISETVSEVVGCGERNDGKTPLMVLRDNGCLDECKTFAAHCVVLNSEDIDILNNYNIYPIHNPASNLKLGSGISPISLMNNRGIKVCIGTDGNGSNNNIDMFREMYLASILPKGTQRIPDCISAYDVLKMATLNGAEALGYNGGCLREGAAADIVILKNSPYLYPLHDPYGIIVYSAGGNDVDTTIVNGKITVENGKCTTINKEEIFNKFMEITRKLF